MPLIKFFHNGMKSKIQYDGDITDSFPVNRGVKQGCVLAPTLFGIYFAYVFKTTFANIPNGTGVSLLTGDDGNFYSLARFKAKTRVEESLFESSYMLMMLQELLDGLSFTLLLD